jgi:hypothetical protein
MEDVYIQTASKTIEEAKTAGENLLGKTIEVAEDFLLDEMADKNLAVDLFEIRFAMYSVSENELTDAEYLIAVKAFRDLFESQTDPVMRAQIICIAKKMRLDIYAAS